jgi:hypothetical protein
MRNENGKPVYFDHLSEVVERIEVVDGRCQVMLTAEADKHFRDLDRWFSYLRIILCTDGETYRFIVCANQILASRWLWSGHKRHIPDEMFTAFVVGYHTNKIDRVPRPIVEA